MINLKRNPIICLLVTGLMIVTLTGQAAAAFRMACEGTTSCCCMTASPVDSIPADMAPMSSSCCETPFSQPCDLAGPAPTSTTPFLPVENNAASDVSPAFIIAASTAADAINCGSFNRISIRPPSLAGPPLYLLIQSFLC